MQAVTVTDHTFNNVSQVKKHIAGCSVYVMCGDKAIEVSKKNLYKALSKLIKPNVSLALYTHENGYKSAYVKSIG